MHIPMKNYVTILMPEKTVSVDGTALNPKAAANPCGLIAKSFFNDTFLPVENNGKIFTI